jgi:hypothetical protein
MSRTIIVGVGMILVGLSAAVGTASAQVSSDGLEKAVNSSCPTVYFKLLEGDTTPATTTNNECVAAISGK